MGYKEIRNIWASDQEEKIIKPKIAAMLKKMREITQSTTGESK